MAHRFRWQCWWCFFRLISYRFPYFNLGLGQKVLRNATGAIDVSNDCTNKQIKCAEYTANNEQNKVAKLVNIYIANRLFIDLLQKC